MVIGLLTVSASLPEARSLKDKRMVLRSVRDRILARMNVSVAETDKQDLWKATELSFVTIADGKIVVEKRLAEVRSLLESNPRLVVLDMHTELL